MGIREDVGRGLGIDRVIGLPADPIPVPLRHARNAELVESPQVLLAGAQSVIVLLKSYHPYGPAAPGAATVSAYYPASNALYFAAQQWGANWRAANDGRSIAHAPLNVKRLLAQHGIGHYGRNGLIAVPEMGSWFAAQVVVTDQILPAPPGPSRDRPWTYSLDPCCAGCHACVKACPVQALDGSGTVDIQRCLRAQAENRPLPEPMRPLVDNCLLGCDICQRVCPRNAAIAPVPIPADVRAALDLRSLLLGHYQPLAAHIGRNFARKTYLQGRSALVAANQGRDDVRDALQPLLNSASEPVRVHAAWAMAQLSRSSDHTP